MHLPSLSILSLAAAVAAQQAPSRTSTRLFHENENHVFNAINSAMKQWGSALDHNGMSFFLTSVPLGTKFYHGRKDRQRPAGIEWYAYEAEHAVLFAKHDRAWHRPPPDHESPPAAEEATRGNASPHPPLHSNIGMPASDTLPAFNLADHLAFEHGGLARRAPPEQIPLVDQPAPLPRSGYLQTYVTKKELRLLYIDGSSAGKTYNGTLDTQDRLLLNFTFERETNGGPIRFAAPFDEIIRADLLCELVDKQWERRIDGFIRTEGGFELLLCSSEDTLDLVSTVRSEQTEDTNRSYFSAITARYDGVGRHRTLVNYDKIVSLYNYPIDLFAQGSKPRVPKLTRAQRGLVLEDLKSLIVSPEEASNTTEWQAVTERIVDRYAPELEYLLRKSWPSVDALRTEIHNFLVPILDREDPDEHKALERCALQHIPDFGLHTPASRAVMRVAHTVCAELITLLDVASLETAKSKIQQLVDELGWTVWKKCGSCKTPELCLIPLWPFGSFEDWERPRCKNVTEYMSSREYWGRKGQKKALTVGGGDV